MTRALNVLGSDRPGDILLALRAALAGGGPAVVPRDPAAKRGRWPEPGATVAQNVALVIETSGSTGSPKRVALSTDALLASAAASAGAMGGQGQWILALPAHYVAGAQVLVRSIAAETEPLIYGGGHFDPVAFAGLAAELTSDLRYVSLVPVQLARLLTAVENGAREVADALRRFDGILVGGQALNGRVRERAAAVGARILGTYGSSETAGGCVYDGTPIGATVVREVDGGLEIAGPTLAEGYLGHPARTQGTFHEADGQRWYRTGDVGRVDAEGRVVVLGRADNVIISGGEKVLLDAVERAVRLLDGYEHAVVVAEDDAEWGQVPVVVTEDVAAAGVERAELAAVREFVAERVGRAAAPSRIVVLPHLPMLSSGKPDRVRVARAVTDSRRNGEA
ncbi:AMP-binding protein [Leifsonia sp. NPDC058292]|uniref:AMP-binding protein n=1 Tax=Leifsonia sp. NPDC058292 TaxID=3346428 RepID=UPI0036D8DE75